ncbi:PaaI family thioesterase [Skermanella pratensis]|uniref:PaaI family thioesterase n=1 Tax=Skermanella pratensis TaxID=2233999 RepID=UPI00130123A0|nr:PaaI family thioesterase [Skermanella pratensis]
MDFTPRDPDFEAKVRSTFEEQPFMRLIGAELVSVAPGTCEISLAVRPDLSQHNGFVHAGVTNAIADNSAGLAAFTLMPPGTDVLSVEFKTNLLAPARGRRLIARGRVEKPGRTLVIVRSDVYAETDGSEVHVAMMQATMICLVSPPPRPYGRP